MSQVNIEEYIKTLLSTVFSAFHIQPVEIESNIRECFLDSGRVILLGLIINEAAANTIKHGFSSEMAARFSVSFHEVVRAGEYVLTLANTGRPFPQEMKVRTTATHGLRLIDSLVQQLQGALIINRKPQATRSIRFPV